jgi:hypothetical protein
MILPSWLIVLAVWCAGALGSAAAAVSYLHHARLRRPPLGVFDTGDLLVLFVSIVLIPVIYALLPSLLLTMLVILILGNILHLGLRPLLSPALTWLLILVSIVANGFALLALRVGWQPGAYLHWTINDLAILMTAVVVSNLYVSCGMSMRQVVWLALFLACYDAVFAWVIPLTPLLVNHFAGLLFEPTFGFTLGGYSGFIGLGDLFTFSLFATAASKGYGRRGTLLAFGVILVCGVLLPAFGLPLLAAQLSRGASNVVPVQVVFGPAVLAASCWLWRRRQEQSVRQ